MLTLLLAPCLLLLTACPSGPPPLEVTGQASVVDGADRFHVVVQTREGELVQMYPGFEEITADADGRAEFDIVPQSGDVIDGVLHATATIRLKGDPPILEKTIQIPAVPRLVREQAPPRLVSSDRKFSIVFDRGLKMRIHAPEGAQVSIGGIPVAASSAAKLPPKAVLTPGLDGVLASSGQEFVVPVQVVYDGLTLQGELPVERSRVMEALAALLAEVPSGERLPGEATGNALAWIPQFGLEPVKFYGDVSKLSDIGRVATAGTEEPTGRTIDCGMYGNEQGDTQRKILEIARVTVDVYDVRSGDKVTSKTFAPSGRCPETIRKGSTRTRVGPRDRDVYAWLETL